jgi:proteic killer suppression protein
MAEMIKTFKHKGLEEFFYTYSFLHKLRGDKKEYYSVMVSGNWRIFFQFIDGDAYVIDYDDYH